MFFNLKYYFFDINLFFSSNLRGLSGIILRRFASSQFIQDFVSSTHPYLTLNIGLNQL